jgi:hypothetical protein
MKLIKQLPLWIRQVMGIAVASVFISAIVTLAATWTGPSANPPGNNPDAPINVGGSAQTKTGALSIGGALSANSLTIYGGGSIGQNPGSRFGIGNTNPGGRHSSPSNVILDVFNENNALDMIITGVKMPILGNDAANKAYVDAQSGGVQYKGVSASTSGNMGGIFGATQKCRTAFPTETQIHMCSYEEVVQSGTILTAQGWVDDVLIFWGGATGLHYCAHSAFSLGIVGINNCGNPNPWTNGLGGYGCAMASSGESAALCNVAIPIHCCK